MFEPFDGTNGTWGTGDPVYRAVPPGFDAFEIVPAPDCLPASAENMLDFTDVLEFNDELAADSPPPRLNWLARVRNFFRRGRGDR